MKKFENIDEVAQALGNGGPFSPDVHFATGQNLVNALVNLGNTDQVYVRHDDHLGLESDLSEEFLKCPLSEIDKPEFESDIELVLEQANIIIPLSERDLSEDDYEEIKEDKLSRGDDTDE